MDEKIGEDLNLQDIGFKEHIKGWWTLHSAFIIKHFIILILSIILGAICGIVMVLFRYLLIISKLGFSFLPYFIAPIIAGILTSLFVKYGKFSRIMGTGLSQFVEDVDNINTGFLEQYEMDFNRKRNLLGKTIATSWTYGSGMVCGIEGPGLLIGGNLGYLIIKSEKFGLRKEDSLFIGASACTAAIFKAPISGALFCAEIPYYNQLRYKSLIPSIIASTVAYIIFCFFFDFTPLIETSHFYLTPDRINYLELLPLLILFGIIIGLIILIFMNGLRLLINNLQVKFEQKSKLWLLPLIGATVYSIFLLIIIPFIGKEFRNILIGPNTSFLNLFVNLIANKSIKWNLLLMIAILFIIAIYISIGSQNSAGLILPMMLLGAIIGAIFGVIFFPEHPELFVLIGISAFLGASLKSPIAAVVLIIEMTWLPFLFVPAGIVTIIAYIFSGPTSIISRKQQDKRDQK